MFHRLGHVLLIAALLAATGGHWALLQTVAWTNMLTENLRTDSLETAVTKTFGGKHPCSLCKRIAAGKKAEQKAEFPSAAKKIEFTHTPSRFVFAAPTDFWLQNERLPVLHSRSHAPPLPPPRSLLG